MTAARVPVPGPRWRPPTDLPHVLVVTGGRGYEKDFRVEHPPECALSCPWWPDPSPGAYFVTEAPRDLAARLEPEWNYDCYVEWETSGCGLGSLAGDLDGRRVDGENWRELPAGRYLIAGWYTPPGWAGSEPVDADGGLDLLGRERPRLYDPLRPRAVRAWPRRLRDSCRARLRRGVRVRGHRVYLRGPGTPPLFSERGRYGCRVLPLGLGWRIVLVRVRG